MKYFLSAIFFIVTMVAGAQTISLAGTWEFQTDSLDQGQRLKWFCGKPFDDTINLPSSMPEQMKGDDISIHTKWVGSLYDSSFFYNPYMEKYRKPGKDMKLTFFLTPDKHYVGVAWYRKTVTLDEVDKNSSYNIYLERPHIETTLYVNGEKVGICNSLVTAHQYDVTRWLRKGKNVITIRVDNRPETVNVGHDSHSITDQTQGDWNGIVGRMELQQVGRVHITDLQVFPDVDKSEALVDMRVTGKQNEKVTIMLHAGLK